MFGATIDYHLLKPFTHRRNRAAEDELNQRAAETAYSLDDARAHLERLRGIYFPTLPVNPQLSYLDVGCGMGRLAIGLSLAGAQNVTGIDIMPRNIVQATAIAAKIPAGQPRPDFICGDIHSWAKERTWDVLFAVGVMEHVRDPGDFLLMLRHLLKPGGLALVSFEPFHSPAGDHMQGFFKLRVPWRGVLFSEEAILRLRRECYRPTDPARRFPEIVGGLNLMRFTEYEAFIRAAGLEVVEHRLNPRLALSPRRGLILPIARSLTSLPVLKDYFIWEAYSVLRFPAGA